MLFDLLSLKLLYKCNQPAQDCLRLLRWISFAKIVIDDLAHGMILPKRRRPENVTNYQNNALFLFSRNHCCVLRLDCPQWVQRCEEDGLSPFFAFSSSSDESFVKDRSDIGRTSSME